MSPSDIPLPPLLILAGGKSQRMGTPKGLLEVVPDEIWIDTQLRLFHEAGGSRVFLVLGYRAEDYFEAVPDLRGAMSGEVNRAGIDLSVVVNTEPEYGPFSSIVHGWRHIREVAPPGSIMVTPLDVPIPSRIVVARMMDGWKAGLSALIPVVGVKGGHPVILSSGFLNGLETVAFNRPEARLDFQLREESPKNVVRVEVNDEDILMDMNTPGDVAIVRARLDARRTGCSADL